MTVSAMLPTAGFLDPQAIITGAGAWGLVIVCLIVFAESGLLVGFFLPGDTLLFFTGVLVFSSAIGQPLWLVILLVTIAAAIGDQVGYMIGKGTGPRIFERRESGFFSRKSVGRTEAFFMRFGPAAVTVARFVPVVRTFAPVAAGVGRMPRRTFTAFNLVGALGWSALVILVGFWLAHIPGVADFTARYIDLMLIGIVVISVVPAIVRAIAARRRAA